MVTFVLSFRRLVGRSLFLLSIAVGPQAIASPMVTFSAFAVGAGSFEYDLTVQNQGGSEPVSGLLILNGGSVFALDNTSIIGAPNGWSFFAPLPPVVDPLSYFALDSTADVPIDGSLEGFFFQSFKDPDALANNDFAVALIGAISGSETFTGTAQPAPEPAIGWFMMLIAAGLAGFRLRSRIYRAS
jgi:hypothetical protein